jgi:tetratricopeptide (TPR) repeat protein
MKTRILVIGMIWVVSGFHNAFALQTPQEFFEQGNTFYKEGNYEAAAKAYEKVLSLGYVSPELYYNLGNAYYRLEQLSRAILAYERAARLRPNDPDITHNLKLCYLKTIDRIEPLPELFLIQWLRAFASILPHQTAEVIFLGSWALLFLSLATAYFVRRRDILKFFRIAIIAFFVITILSGLLFGIQALLDTSAHDAIITSNTVTAKSSPDPKSIDAFVIHEGLKVKVTDSVENWVKITLPDGKIGWIESSQCEKI